ncbi:hypothetical protein ANO11243_029880 [Dothideomycetidae sp. 11243]|uniref:Thioesterase frbD n=1 Tax=Dothideomycetidae sp. (strain 11243) TaxID=1603295 RepID=FRBD_DOTX1|nr:RecName: Full=Thioesterase frbD; AltName: Full=FR901469 biosynthesis cluster protein D [fungal sp. No.11243]GAM84985.1 hypothetical protein ANO11243_029880 [fungal sp. No.11243]
MTDSPAPRASVQLIQTGGAAMPLVLIHDACGTIYTYHALSKLGRTVYGIGNPRFEKCTSWTGGIGEMAACYHAAIKQRIRRGKILVGGWSLGGVIALEIARLFADDAAIHVHGVVLIDSPFPSKATVTGEDLQLPPLPPGLPANRRQSVAFAMREAVDLLGDWDPKASWQRADKKPPPAALIRALDYLPGSSADAQRDEFLVDRMRTQKLLGWENSGLDFIRATYEAPGHHWGIFSSENVACLSDTLSKACAELEVVDGGR